MSDRDNQRGTGRTTRLVAKALLAAYRNDRVYFVIAHSPMKDYVMSLTRDLCEGPPPTGFHIVTEEYVKRSPWIVRTQPIYYDHFRG